MCEDGRLNVSAFPLDIEASMGKGVCRIFIEKEIIRWENSWKMYFT